MCSAPLSPTPSPKTAPLLFPDLFSPEEERFWELSSADGTPYDVVDPVDRQCAVHWRERGA
jgi:hypothetical protein